MTDTLNWIQWLEIVEVPAFGFVIAWLLQVSAELNRKVERCQGEHHRSLTLLSAQVAEFRVEVAKVYATLTTVHDVRDELMGEFRRLSDKLDGLRDQQQREIMR